MARDEVGGSSSPANGRWLTAIPVSLGLAVVSLLFFAWLSEEMLEQGTQHFDERVRLVLHQLASPALTWAMRIITNLGDWRLVLSGTLLLLFIFWYRGARAYLRLLLVTMIGAGILDGVLKLAFHRPRPTPFFAAKPDTYSFPSGHALISLCFYGLIAGMLSLRWQKHWQRTAIWTTAVLIVGLIGFSRIYLGVHWPSDVIAGYAAALMWMGAVRLLAKRSGERPAKAVLK
jgi:undecaprenyl-diphosphatase